MEVVNQLLSLAIQGQIGQTNTENNAGKVPSQKLLNKILFYICLKQVFILFLKTKTGYKHVFILFACKYWEFGPCFHPVFHTQTCFLPVFSPVTLFSYCFWGLRIFLTRIKTCFIPVFVRRGYTTGLELKSVSPMEENTTILHNSGR